MKDHSAFKNKYSENDNIKMLEFQVNKIFAFLSGRSSGRQSTFEWVQIEPLSSSSFYIHKKRNSYRLSSQTAERNCISGRSHLQVHRWCIVHKHPRLRKLSWSDISCWTWDQKHHREHNFCFSLRFTKMLYCRSGEMVNFTLPFMTNEMILISTSQTFGP